METRREVQVAASHDGCSVHDPCEKGKPESCPKEPARRKREADKRGWWDTLVVKKEPGGLRHYLDGKPVHCGTTLRLQHHGEKSDDYGEYSVPLQESSAVRYEASQDGSQIQATLF